MTTETSLLSHPKYRPDIDGLRAVAVLSVVIYHAFPSMLRGGFIGVDVFFVISGFLISSIIFESLERGSFSFAQFYVRRINRIFPALLAVFLACYGVGWFLLAADEYQQLAKHLIAGAGFVSNFVLWMESGYFDTSAETKPLLHLWSLGIEEQFYIVWPLMVWLAWKARINALNVAMILALASFYLNLNGMKTDPVATFFLPQTRGWELLCGSLLAWLSCRHRGIADRLRGYAARYVNLDSRIWPNSVALLGGGVLLLGFLKISKDVSFPGKWAVLPVAGAVLLIAAGPFAWFNRKILSHKLLVWIGLISFPLYLWHWPILVFARLSSPDELSVGLRLLAVILSILFAWLTYRWVERPIRAGGNGKTKTLALVFAMTFVAGIAGTTFYLDGLAFRAAQQRVNALYPETSRAYESELISSFKNYYGNPASDKPVILLIGDSYVTNWGVAISRTIDLDRYDLAAVSYLGCSVTLERDRIRAIPTEEMYDRNCGMLEKLLNDRRILDRSVVLMLVSHRPFEYTSNSFRFDLIRSLVNKRPDMRLAIFGNYFQLDPKVYPSCEKLMARVRASADICIERAVYPSAQYQEDSPSQAFYPADIKFSYVNVTKALCEQGNGTCPYESQGVPFMLDWNHLSAAFLTRYIPEVFGRSKALSSYLKR